MNMRREVRAMSSPQSRDEEILRKLRSLPPEKLAEVEDFVDFLRHRDVDGKLAHAASRFSEDVFQEVWDNPLDADYDRL
jgi:hypothetical protein